MITALALMSLYKTPTIRLDEICERYLNLSPAEATKRAARAELPFPAFKLNDSRKAPWCVSAEVLEGLDEGERVVLGEAAAGAADAASTFHHSECAAASPHPDVSQQVAPMMRQKR